AHDLSMVRHISDEIAVMYLGHLVEKAETEDLFRRPLHPYTRGLLAAVPVPDPRRMREREKVLLTGDVKSADAAQGCPFAGRCPWVTDRCRVERPELRELMPGHMTACHRVEELLPEWEKEAQ